jgi:hypothetical protein
MLKVLIVSFLFVVVIIEYKSNSVKPYNYERDTPAWLKVKIDSITATHRDYYYGTKVYRYKWKGTFLFEFDIPLSSCVLCELYYYDGTKTNFPDSNTVSDYENNKTDKMFIWKYPEL